MKIRRDRSVAFRIIVGTLLSFAVLLLICNLWVIYATRFRVFDSIPLIPANNTGLLMCTNEILSMGEVNLYFEYRIQGAVDLYSAGKVHQLIISGEHRSEAPDELLTMKQALINRGIPETDIILDSSAHTTFDSVLRTYRIFGRKKFTIISDRFHDYRALFIGLYHRADIIAFATENVPLQYSARARFKEYFLRLKAIGDLYLFHRTMGYYETDTK